MCPTQPMRPDKSGEPSRKSQRSRESAVIPDEFPDANQLHYRFDARSGRPRRGNAAAKPNSSHDTEAHRVKHLGKLVLSNRAVINNASFRRRRIGAAAVCALLLQAAAATPEFEVETEQHPAQAILEQASAAIRVDPEQSRNQAEQALTLLEQRPDADLQVRARLILCDYQSERDTVAAEQQIARIVSLLDQVRRKGLRSGMLDCQGQIAETAGNNAKALEFYRQAVSVGETTGDDEMLAAALFSSGHVLSLQGHYAAGLADLKHAQSLYEHLKLPQHALTVLNAIAILYNRMGDYAQARDMYLKAIKAQRQTKLLREQAVTLHNLGRAYEKLKDWPEARSAYEESLRISRDLRYSRAEAYALRGLASVANGVGQPQAALDALREAETLQRETPDVRLQAQIYFNRGLALHQLRRLPQSARALEDALRAFGEAASLGEQQEAQAELASTYADLGEWRVAYDHLAKASEIASEQFRNQIDQHFASLKVEFDTAAKDKENAMLLRENHANEIALAQGRKARNLQAVVIALTVALAVMLLALVLHQRRTTMRMRSLAMTDELTGVPNRRAVLARLEPLLNTPGQAACAMLIIDIDHFKSINDQYGHAEGDEALKLVAAQLRTTVKEPGFVGRLGGEEFVAVLPETALAPAIEVAEKLCERLMVIDTRLWMSERRISASIGVTVSIPGTDSSSSMLQRADAALYDAKRAGRNCVRSAPAHAAAGGEKGRKVVGLDASPVEYA